MNNLFSTLTGVSGGGLILVGEDIIDIGVESTIRIIESSKPSYLMIDLSSAESAYSFTIGNLMTSIGLSFACLGALIAFLNWISARKDRLRKRRKEDTQ